MYFENTCSWFRKEGNWGWSAWRSRWRVYLWVVTTIGFVCLLVFQSYPTVFLLQDTTRYTQSTLNYYYLKRQRKTYVLHLVVVFFASKRKKKVKVQSIKAFKKKSLGSNFSGKEQKGHVVHLACFFCFKKKSEDKRYSPSSSLHSSNDDNIMYFSNGRPK